MSQFQLFDSVKLKEEIPVDDGKIAAVGCPGAIVEIFNDGEAYMVELFGRWVTIADNGEFIQSTPDAVESFMETVGVETVSPHQLRLVTPARETVGVRAQLLALMDELPENTLEEVRNFAEFLKTKQIDTLRAS
ncbi:MAG: hypothetical protein AAFV90_01230 [Cyanobacteria bacterium J06634_5]